MNRLCQFVLFLSLVAAPGASSAGLLVDLNKYPADFSLVLNPNVPVQIGVNFFTQIGSPVSPHRLLGTFPFLTPANTSTDVGPSFDGNPIGVYKSFSLQYQSYLGVSTDTSGNSTLLAVLRPNVGIGKTFNEVFGNSYSEDEVIDAILRLASGDTSGVILLFDLMFQNLNDQPLYSQVGPATYALDPAELVKFSTGTSGGTVVGGSYFIPTVAVPEPSTWTITVLGLVAVVACRIRRSRGRRPSAPGIGSCG